MEDFKFALIVGVFGLSLSACSGGRELSVDERDDTPQYQHFIGAMHEHSGYSDGAIGTTPADYYAAGKSLGLDYVAGSEHSDNANLPLTANTDCLSEQLPECLMLSPEGFFKWNASADLAAAATDESFTAIRGFEWTSDRYGHINVFFSQNDLNAKTDLGYLLWMEPFWQWLNFDPDTFGGGDGIIVFNHPGREDMFHTACENLGPLADICGTVLNGDPAYTWNDFEYRPELADRVVGIEMYGKSSHYYDGDNGAPLGGWYAHALDKGWRLGPVGAEDEHGHEWAQPTRAKTVILAEDRGAESLKQAMLARRFYALAHYYNDVRIDYSATNEDGQLQLMGGGISHAPGASVRLELEVHGVDLPRVEFIGSLGEVLATMDASHASFEFSAAGNQSEWVFARVLDLADQDADERLGEVVAVSAPIWVQAAQ